MNKIKLKNRFASIWFPQLPLETILSKEPLLDSLPLVVSFSEGEEIICTNGLAKKLNIPEDKYIVTYQSRLTNKWLSPFTDEVLESLPKDDKKNVLVFSPAFTADCLETIIEIGDEYKELFEESGGENLDYVESLNYSDLWAGAIIDIIK